MMYSLLLVCEGILLNICRTKHNKKFLFFYRYIEKEQTPKTLLCSYIPALSIYGFGADNYWLSVRVHWNEKGELIKTLATSWAYNYKVFQHSGFFSFCTNCNKYTRDSLEGAIGSFFKEYLDLLTSESGLEMFQRCVF